MGHCKDCKWWDTKTGHHGRCLNERINSGDMICDLAVNEYECSEGAIEQEIETWGWFGCVLFEEKG